MSKREFQIRATSARELLEDLCSMHEAIIYPEEESGGVTIFASPAAREAFYKIFPELRWQGLLWVEHGYGMGSKDGGNTWESLPGDESWNGIPADWKRLSHFDMPRAMRLTRHNLTPINDETWEALSEAAPQALAFLLAITLDKLGVRAVTIDNNDVSKEPAIASYRTGGTAAN
jgi:hypothetical protein